MSGIFLDRRVLLDGLMAIERRGGSFLGGKLGSYDSVVYEALGASGLEVSLAEVADLGDRLVGIRSSEMPLSRKEKALFDDTLSLAAVRPSIVRAAAEYQRSARSKADLMDSVSYALRLLRAGRDGNLDIGLHRARLPVISSLFEESGVHLKPADADGVVLSEPCGFPYLPRSSPGSTIYRLVTFGEDYRVVASGPSSPAVSEPPAGGRIFIAYSHQDRIWLDRLLVGLSPLVREGEIDVWSDQRIKPGQRWLEEIDQALTATDVGILLVTSSFLASDFIARHEIPHLMERHSQGKTAITWVAVSASLYNYTPIKEFQALNNPGRPLAEFSPARREREIVSIATKIQEMLAGSAAR